jgi:hypothetical protein
MSQENEMLKFSGLKFWVRSVLILRSDFHFLRFSQMKILGKVGFVSETKFSNPQIAPCQESPH